MTTAAIRKAVLAKFCAPEWATFLEVHNSTGATQRRSADAMAMNLFPSRGLRLHGFEFKASRGDWLRELKQPAKSESIQRYCDHWWIVTLPDIVKPDELPPTWGLYVLKGSGLHAVTKAPELESQPVDRPFMAALLRRAHEFAGRDLNEAVKKRTAEDEARAAERVRTEIERGTREYRALREAVDTFEASSGFSIANMWGGGDAEIGAAVKLVKAAGVLSTYGGVRRLAEQAREFAERVERTMAEIGATPVDAET